MIGSSLPLLAGVFTVDELLLDDEEGEDFRTLDADDTPSTMFL